VKHVVALIGVVGPERAATGGSLGNDRACHANRNRMGVLIYLLLPGTRRVLGFKRNDHE
jgi:hypothetical protein